MTFQCIQYNLTNGKLNRGTTVPLTLKLLSKNEHEDISKDKLKEAFILGWCIEFVRFIIFKNILFEEKKSHTM